MKYLIVVSVLLLAGCDEVSTSSKSIGMFAEIKELKLSDGTRCAVYEGTHGGGITCNWITK